MKKLRLPHVIERCPNRFEDERCPNRFEDEK